MEARMQLAALRLALGFALCSTCCLARDNGQWEGSDPKVRQWYQKLMQPDNPRVSCCGEADGVFTARQTALKLLPDLVILDLRLGQGDGFELIKYFNEDFPTLKILVLSQHDETIYAERVLKAGAHGFLMKEEDPKEVVNAIRFVLAGGLYVSPKISGLILRKLVETPSVRPARGVESLTDRELQVFQMLGGGMTTRRIAAELFLSFKTVETHRENIKAKMGLADSAALIHQATTLFRRGHLESL